MEFEAYVLKVDLSGSKRRWSGIELPHNFARSFRMQFLKEKDKMKHLLEKIQMIAAEVKKSMTGLIAGSVVAGAGLGAAALAAPFTGGLSLMIFGAASATSVAGGLTVYGSGKNAYDYMSEVQPLTKEFIRITEQLEEELRRLKDECRELRRSGRSSTVERLENSINQLFDVIAELRTPRCAAEVEAAADQCQKVYYGFVDVASELP